jgi:hypothetical protein
MYVPVRCDASPVARNSAVPATSSGRGIRPMGVIERSFSARPLFQSCRFSLAWVSMNPGANVLTRTVGANAAA